MLYSFSLYFGSLVEMSCLYKVKSHIQSSGFLNSATMADVLLILFPEMYFSNVYDFYTLLEYIHKLG